MRVAVRKLRLGLRGSVGSTGGPEVVGGGVVVVVVVVGGGPVTFTLISHREYPYCVARCVPFIRTNRPVPVTSSVCVPPVPVVVEKIVVQPAPSAET